MEHVGTHVEPPSSPQAAAPLLVATDLQDHLLMASNDLDRLHTLLTDASTTLLQRFYNATEQIHALMDAHSSDGDDKRDSVAYQELMQQLGAAVTALQFQDMASQLIVHTNHRLRGCVDMLAREAFGDDDEDGPSAPPAPPLRPNPVTQSEMDAGSVDLF